MFDVRLCVQINGMKEVNYGVTGTWVVMWEAIGEGLELEGGVGL